MSLYLELLAARYDEKGAAVADLSRPLYPLSVGERPVSVGRAPDNDVVLADETISWHHAVLEVRRGQLWVRDLGSTNGTAIEERGVLGESQAPPGALIRMGRRSFFRFVPPPQEVDILLEDLESGLRFALSTRPLRIGRGEAVPLDVGAASPASLEVRGTSVYLQVGGEEKEIQMGVDFLIGPREFRLLQLQNMARKTVGQKVESLPYQLIASPGRATGPEATLLDRVRGQSHTIRSENRAVLLYLLARRMVEDRSAGQHAKEAGWCTDEEVAVGIWGRDGERMEAGNLHVLIHRLRKEIEEAGFDSSFIEKHRKAMRVNLNDVYLR